MKQNLIAPCGMNCNLCHAYLREINTCPGCRRDSKTKPKSCTNCVIKNCSILLQNKWRFCTNKCLNYPCDRLKRLDKRYKNKYEMSMLDNLEFIEKNSLRKFILAEKKKWIKDGRIYCVHKKEYFCFKEKTK